MRNRAVVLARAAQVEQRHNLVDLRRGSSQEKPAAVVSVMTLRILRQLGGSVMFGIDRDRDYRRVGSQSRTELLRNCNHLGRQHRTDRRARGVYEINQHRLALE